MGALDLTVKVTEISQNATPADVISFFSYCGTVDDLELKSVCIGSRDGEEAPQSALVTFRQPYAFETALLLNGAILVDRPVCIASLANPNKDRTITIDNNATEAKELDERYRLTWETVLNNPCFAKSVLWISNVLSKRTSKG